MFRLVVICCLTSRFALDFPVFVDAPAEAVKRKVSDDESAATVDDGESVPEKKAKIAAEEATNGDAAKEEVAA